MRAIRNLSIFVVVAALLYSAGLFDHALGRDAKAINGTVTTLTTYPEHTRDNVTATRIDGTEIVTTGPVRWPPAREVCFRYDNGTDGCWNAIRTITFRELSVGQHLDDEPMGGDFCAPHPTPSDEAVDLDCPAYTALDADLDDEMVIPNA